MQTNLSTAVLLYLLLIFVLPAEGIAQKAIGAKWSVPDDNRQAIRQLDTFRQLGVDRLIIDIPLNESVWNRIDSLQLTVLAELPINYPVVSTFASPDSALIDEITSRLNHFTAESSVEAIGLFRFGQIRNSNFDDAIQPLIQQIAANFSTDLYYTSLTPDATETDSLVVFKLIAIDGYPLNEQALTPKPGVSIGGYIYNPGQSDSLLTPVKTILTKASGDSVPVFFESDWLLGMTEVFPELESSLRYYTSTSELLFPLPEETFPVRSQHSSIVILLLVIWGLFVVNYHINPVYKKASTRYFSAHKFLVSDIMKRHIRSITPAVIIIIQHMLATGIAAYCLGNILFAENGFDAISHHFPALFFTGSPLWSLFFWGCLISFVFHLISILWIGLLNKQVKYTSQVALLYSWPLQINFIIVTLMVTLMMAASAPGIFYLLAGFFALILTGSFAIAAFDTSYHPSGGKKLFLVSSLGVYCILLTGLAVWILRNNYLIEVLQLAASLG